MAQSSISSSPIQFLIPEILLTCPSKGLPTQSGFVQYMPFWSPFSIHSYCVFTEDSRLYFSCSVFLQSDMRSSYNIQCLWKCYTFCPNAFVACIVQLSIRILCDVSIKLWCYTNSYLTYPHYFRTLLKFPILIITIIWKLFYRAAPSWE